MERLHPDELAERNRLEAERLAAKQAAEIERIRLENE